MDSMGLLVHCRRRLAGFLLWVMFHPRSRFREAEPAPVPVPELPSLRYHRIGVAVEFGKRDNAVLAQAAAVARAHEAPLLLIHVVEGPGADYYGPATDDQESRTDRQRIGELVKYLQAEGLQAEGVLGYGEPAAELVRIARKRKLRLSGAGHTWASLFRRFGWAKPSRPCYTVCKSRFSSCQHPFSREP